MGPMHQVGAVIVGFDRRINYHKIQTATLCIRENPGCHFIATNLDAVTHLTDAQEWAGNGAMVGAIKGAHVCVTTSDGHRYTSQTCGVDRMWVGSPCQSAGRVTASRFASRIASASPVWAAWAVTTPPA